MKALTFDFDIPRLAAARALGAVSAAGYLGPLGPLRLLEVPDAHLLGDRWVVVATAACGICGSDVKQAFLDAAMDNPLTAVISFPHVMGHEHVGTVVETGRAVTRVKVGDRVACSPWFSCEVRGLPPCPACRCGDVSLCENFTEGPFAPGMHAGTCRDISGGFAPLVPVHESACHIVPDAVPFATAVLADPCAVALHAILKSPPQPGQTVLVYGCGGLGVLVVHLLARLFPGVRVLAVDPRPHARALAEQMGAAVCFASRGAELIEDIGKLLAIPVRRPQLALPWLQGGVDRVYDTVGSAGTLETAVRVTRALGVLVLVGVATPARFEWTPLYFKELVVMGSSGYGDETFDARRGHAFDLVLGFLEEGKLDLSRVVTHRFPLAAYKEAFLTARSKGSAPAIKVVLEMT